MGFVLDEVGALPPEISVVLPVSPEDAFVLLTDPERLRRWKTVSARVDLRAGGTYRWTIVPGHAVRGTYLEVEKGRRLVFGWGWEGSRDLGPDASTVTVTFEPTEGGTLVRLVHTGLTDEQAATHLAGWQHFFARLAVASAEGEAGPDEWAAVPDPLTDLACAEAAFAVCLRALRAASASGPRQREAADELAEQLADRLRRLAAAADVEAYDPGPSVGAEPRVAEVGQQAFEAWAGRDPAEPVTYEGIFMRGELALAWTAIDLLVHAVETAGLVGDRPAVAAPLGHFLRSRAGELQANGAGGDGGAPQVLTRLEAALATP
jgi:uncharacterized protein YndB with AHSA1/START domain